MNTPFKVSFCIPVYNGEKFVAQTIGSILNQNYENIEIIVVDDASSDNTLEVVKKFKDKGIRLVKNKKNLGMVGNWNRCVSLAKGEYLKLLMADDILVPQSLHKEIFVLDNNPNVGICYGYVRPVDEKGKLLNTPEWNSKTYQLYSKDTLVSGDDCLRMYLNSTWKVGLPSASLVRRRCFEKLGNFDPDGLDPEMWARICTKYDLFYLKSPVVDWRIRSTGTFTSQNTRFKNLGRDIRRLWKMRGYDKLIVDEKFRREFNQLRSRTERQKWAEWLKTFITLVKKDLPALGELMQYSFFGGTLDRKFTNKT